MTFPIRSISDALWQRAKMRALRDRLPMQQVIRRLVEEYVKHGLRPVKE